MKKGFLGGLFGCFGVGVAILIVIIVIGAIASSHSGSTGSGSSPSATSGTSAKPLAAPKVLLDVSGNGSKTTQKFQAPSDWTIDYSYDCSSFGQSGNFVVTVEGDAFDIAANQLGMKGTDTANVHQGGNVYLSIDSECQWHITAKG